MSEKIVQLNEGIIKSELKELVRSSVEETLNGLLEQEAQQLTKAARYERSQDRQGYRSGHYSRNLTTTSGDVELKMPKLKGVSFETAIIERYRRRESSVEEALIEMYLAGLRNLQHVAGFRRLSGRQQPLVQNKQFGAFVLLHHLLVSAGAMNHGQILEQFGQPDICGEIPAQV